MSWSISLIGKPENVVEALTAHSASLTGQSKVEYDETYPAIATLVSQNVNGNAPGNNVIKVVANGHANIGTDGIKTYGQCSVVIEPFYSVLV